MRRLALALLLATPLSAYAQYVVPLPPPPPRPVLYGYPPPPLQAVPAAPAPSPFYVNLGIGYGGTSWYASPVWATGFGGLAYHVEAGARLAPQLLLGFDFSGVSTFGNYAYGTAGTTMLDYDAVLTIFPFVRGLFLRAGGGLSTLTVSPPYAPGVTSVGSNVLLGSGYAIPVSPQVSVTLGVDWNQQFFGGPDVTGASTWTMRVGVGFY